MIDTQAIRSKILDLAMRGQLTEQLPADGSAEELYQRIQKEKEALIAKKKIKKEKILPSVTKDEEPYSIPETWKWVRLGDLTTKISSGSTPTGGRKSDVYVLEGYPFFREQNIYNDGIHRKGLVFITEELLNSRKNSVVIAKDILLNITGGSIGRCALIPDNFSKGSINQHILIIRMVEPALRRYIHRCICAPFAQSYIKNKAVGDKDGFSGGRCKKMLIPLPPLEEQKRIVEKIHQAFSVLDTIDELQKQYTANLSALKSKLIDAAIQGKLTEQLPEDGTAEELYQQIQVEKQELITAKKIKKGRALPEITKDEIPFEIPANWKWVRLSEILLVQPSNGYSPKGVEYETQFKNLTLTATTNGYFKPEAYKYVDITTEVAEKYYLTNGDILIQRSNSRELVGTSCIYKHGNRAYIYPDLMMRIHTMPCISVEYIDTVLKSTIVRNYYRQAASGSSESMPKINQKTVQNTLVPIPPLDEQKRIVMRLDAVLKEIEA